MDKRESSRSEQVLQIDEHALDRECVDLPNDYWRAASQSAEAKKDVAEAEAEVELYCAKLGQQIRDTPGKFGMDKVTEASIKEAIRSQTGYIQLEKKVRDAKYQQDLADALVRAFEMKKRALTNLVELHGMGWFSNVRPSARGSEAVKELTRNRIKPYRREKGE